MKNGSSLASISSIILFTADYIKDTTEYFFGLQFYFYKMLHRMTKKTPSSINL